MNNDDLIDIYTIIGLILLLASGSAAVIYFL